MDSKKAEQAEKEARGEIMNKNFKSKISNKSRENVNIKSKRRKKRLRKKPEKKAEDVEIEETCQGVRQFRGTSM